MATGENVGRLGPTSNLSQARVTATGSSTARSLAAWTADQANVIAEGADPTGGADSTAAFVAALAKGKNVRAPSGVYLVDPIAVPATFSGQSIVGDGFWHYGSTKGTIIKARTVGQDHVFALSSGADNVTFRGLRIDGDGKAAKGIDGTYGAFLSLDEVGVYGTTGHGIYSLQGLARLRRVFVGGNAAIGAHIYSDSSIADSEFTGGTIPLLLTAGGNRLVNVWANGGTVTNMRLAPFDDTTNHINLSAANLYIGETLDLTGTLRPAVEIAGTAAQRIQQVMITGSFFVHGEASHTNYVNGLISITNANDVTITGSTFRGQDTDATATRRTDYAIKATGVDTLVISGNTFRGINRNPIQIATSPYSAITGNVFQNCGASQATGDEGANVLLADDNSRAAITGNIFYVANGSTVPYAVKGTNATLATVANNLIAYAGSTVYSFATGVGSGSFQRAGGVLEHVQLVAARNDSRTNFNTQGTASGAGSATITLTTFADLAEDQSYFLMVQQQGAGANGTFGIVTVRSSSIGVATIGNTNAAAALQNSFSVSGLAVQMTMGSGYGSTTWLYTLLRIG